jgi:hypothetical protein
MPDTAWPIDRHPPGSSRDTNPAPVSMPPSSLSTPHQWFARARLRDPHLPRSKARLFPRRSPPRLLTAAARGWFATSACTAAAEGHQTRRPGSSISCTAPHPVTWSSTSSLLQRSCSHSSSRSSTADLRARSSSRPVVCGAAGHARSRRGATNSASPVLPATARVRRRGAPGPRRRMSRREPRTGGLERFEMPCEVALPRRVEGGLSCTRSGERRQRLTLPRRERSARPKNSGPRRRRATWSGSPP